MSSRNFFDGVVLALSGGAARGAYHLGVIDILEKHSIPIQAICGTSIGAIVGASIASGNSAKETLEIFKSKKFQKMFRFSFTKASLLKINRDEEIVQSLVKVKNFDELNIPLHVTVLDILESEYKYIDSGELLEVLFASSALTPLFPAVEIDGSLYADGGIIDNLPLEALKKYNLPIVGVNLFPKTNTIPNSIFGWIKKNIYLTWQYKDWNKEKECDIYLSNTLLGSMSLFGFKDIDKAYALGQVDMQKIIQKLS